MFVVSQQFESLHPDLFLGWSEFRTISLLVVAGVSWRTGIVRSGKLILVKLTFGGIWGFTMWQEPTDTINQNSLFRSRDWLPANQGPVFPDSDTVGFCYVTCILPVFSLFSSLYLLPLSWRLLPRYSHWGHSFRRISPRVLQPTEKENSIKSALGKC